MNIKQYGFAVQTLMVTEQQISGPVIFTVISNIIRTP
jgi:hypothetical protein